MKPFILKQHDKDHAALRELRAGEMEAVYGGGPPTNTPKLNTTTVTPRGSGDDGRDEG